MPEYTVFFSRIILLIAMVEAFNWPVSMMIYATGEIGLYNIVTGLAGLLVLPFSYLVLTMGLSPVSVYIVSLLISLFVQVLSLFCLKKVAAISFLEYVQMVVLPCGLVVIMSAFIPFGINAIMSESFLRLVVSCSLCIPYILVIAYYFGFNKSEKALLVGYIKTVTGRFLKKSQNG